jgi:hypothetical protein
MNYEEYLNDVPVPEMDKKSNGGLIPDNTTKWGTWLRKNDPIAFEVGYNEWDVKRLFG